MSKQKSTTRLVTFAAFGATILLVVLAYVIRFSIGSTSDPQAAAPATWSDPVPALTEEAAAESESTALPLQLNPITAMLQSFGITVEDLLELPRPAIDAILPAGLETVTTADLQPYAAVPEVTLTPAFASPDDDWPVLVLEQNTNTVIEPIPARWTVVGREPGWVRVIVPVGRGALPSEDPAAVNHQAVWVPEESVTIEEEPQRIEISVSERRLTVFDGETAVADFPVGVGIEGVTDTPLGLCSVIGRVYIQTDDDALLTSCQSEKLDEYAGSSWATIALHEGSGFSVTAGGAVSNGCIRVPPALFQEYLAGIRIGTPVVIVP